MFMAVKLLNIFDNITRAIYGCNYQPRLTAILDFETFTEEYPLCNQFVKMYHFQKQPFKGKQCKSMINRSCMIENPNVVLLLFSMADSLKNGIGEWIYPQIVTVNILICFKGIDFSVRLLFWQYGGSINNCM